MAEGSNRVNISDRFIANLEKKVAETDDPVIQGLVTISLGTYGTVLDIQTDMKDFDARIDTLEEDVEGIRTADTLDHPFTWWFRHYPFTVLRFMAVLVVVTSFVSYWGLYLTNWLLVAAGFPALPNLFLK